MVAIERLGQRAGQLALVLRKHPDAVSRCVNRSARARDEDLTFAKATSGLDTKLSCKALKGLGARDQSHR